MNSSTLRRLASDRSSLYTSELPPYYLFSPTDNDLSASDDLTQLTVLLTGPQGTPYSLGLWKLHLKIPDDYPKSPPKAWFRTRIWHPNVEENTGSICVDTLKRDWDPQLTLRDVLITISCLLIQPNPDSALNSTAGHLLQDDYESFARQAKLMTSIHARIPTILRDNVFEAKRRGDAIPTAERDDRDQRPSVSVKSLNSSSFDTRKQPYLKNFSRETFSSPRSFLNMRCIEQNETSDEEIEDEICASKENDPSQSPSPVISQSPRKSIVAKRPLSDLPTSTNPDFDYEIGSGLSTSERNIINNKAQLPPHLPNLDLKQKVAKLADRSRIVSFTTCNQQDVSNDGLAIMSSGAQLCDIIDPPAAKRHCSGEGKENAEESHRQEGDAAITTTPVAVDENAWPNKLSFAAMRKPSSSSGVNKGVRPRAGLRRL